MKVFGKRDYTVDWLDAPEDHDYNAAAEYLSLLIYGIPSGSAIIRLVDDLRTSCTTSYCAKDLLRASQLPLLPVDNKHVAKDIRKIKDGKKLSPVLLVRTDNFRPLVVADGYHRICAVYYLSENERVRCRISQGSVYPRCNPYQPT